MSYSTLPLTSSIPWLAVFTAAIGLIWLTRWYYQPRYWTDRRGGLRTLEDAKRWGFLMAMDYQPLIWCFGSGDYSLVDWFMRPAFGSRPKTEVAAIILKASNRETAGALFLKARESMGDRQTIQGIDLLLDCLESL